MEEDIEFILDGAKPTIFSPIRSNGIGLVGSPIKQLPFSPSQFLNSPNISSIMFDVAAASTPKKNQAETPIKDKFKPVSRHFRIINILFAKKNYFEYASGLKRAHPISGVLAKYENELYINQWPITYESEVKNEFGLNVSSQHKYINSFLTAVINSEYILYFKFVIRDPNNLHEVLNRILRKFLPKCQKQCFLLAYLIF